MFPCLLASFDRHQPWFLLMGTIMSRVYNLSFLLWLFSGYPAYMWFSEVELSYAQVSFSLELSWLGFDELLKSASLENIFSLFPPIFLFFFYLILLLLHSGTLFFSLSYIHIWNGLSNIYIYIWQWTEDFIVSIVKYYT